MNDQRFSDHLSSTYPLPEQLQISEITVGLIHQTLLVKSTRGDQWIAQGLHPLLSSPAILSDYEAVTTHLAQCNYGGPQLIKTRKGERASEYEGIIWRLSTYVPGETYTAVQNPKHAYLGGLGIARFHQTIQSIDYQFQSTHPGHDTPGHLNRLLLASQNPKHQNHWKEIQEWGEEILSELSATLFPVNLPKSIVHGDPKMSNLRFQESQAIMIDLDTCNLHTRLVDLGDAIRSWCHQPEAELGSRFSIDLCQALIAGYLKGAVPLSPLEEEWLPQAGRVITLELASRFALDYLEDHYFAYDEINFDSRRAHNFHRVQMMCQLAREMREAAPQIAQWLKKLPQESS